MKLFHYDSVMKNNNVEVNLVSVNEGFAYDVKINSDEATLSEYVEALDNFLDEKVAPCLGCDNCCYQRIPLMLPDIYDYAGFAQEAVGEFLGAKAVIAKEGLALDIRLKQVEDEACVFLDSQEQRCTDHIHRSLVCHTYVCLPQTLRAREMREYLINQGEDALIAQLFNWNLLAEFADLQHNYPVKENWQGKTYQEILLKEVLSPKLWAALTNPL